jgi:hypothetical protein
MTGLAERSGCETAREVLKGFRVKSVSSKSGSIELVL